MTTPSVNIVHPKADPEAVTGLRWLEKDVQVSPAAFKAVRAGFNPSKLDEVAVLKTLAAALVSYIDEAVPESREASLAKTKVEEATMWAVKGATANE